MRKFLCLTLKWYNVYCGYLILTDYFLNSWGHLNQPPCCIIINLATKCIFLKNSSILHTSDDINSSLSWYFLCNTVSGWSCSLFCMLLYFYTNIYSGPCTKRPTILKNDIVKSWEPAWDQDLKPAPLPLPLPLYIISSASWNPWLGLLLRRNCALQCSFQRILARRDVKLKKLDYCDITLTGKLYRILQ